MISDLFRRLADPALLLLTPPRCRVCRCALFGHANPYLCPECVASMSWIGDGACRGCAFPAGEHAAHAGRCFRCRGGAFGLTAAAAVARYKGGAKYLVKALKFGGETVLVDMMGGLMAERLRGTDFFNAVDAIAPVCLHRERWRRRGFDQAVLLAERVGEICGLPVEGKWLRRVRATSPQAALRRATRLVNLQGAFQADPAVAGKRVLLIDDVMTTGATMFECSKVLREAGAKRVYGLSFAR